MFCKCCRQFHSLDFSNLVEELTKDTKRIIWNGLSLDQIDNLILKLKMAKIELTDEGLKNIEIINTNERKEKELCQNTI